MKIIFIIKVGMRTPVMNDLSFDFIIYVTHTLKVTRNLDMITFNTIATFLNSQRSSTNITSKNRDSEEIRVIRRN